MSTKRTLSSALITTFIFTLGMSTLVEATTRGQRAKYEACVAKAKDDSEKVRCRWAAKEEAVRLER